MSLEAGWLPDPDEEDEIFDETLEVEDLPPGSRDDAEGRRVTRSPSRMPWGIIRAKVVFLAFVGLNLVVLTALGTWAWKKAGGSGGSGCLIHPQALEVAAKASDWTRTGRSDALPPVTAESPRQRFAGDGWSVGLERTASATGRRALVVVLDGLEDCDERSIQPAVSPILEDNNDLNPQMRWRDERLELLFSYSDSQP